MSFHSHHSCAVKADILQLWSLARKVCNSFNKSFDTIFLTDANGTVGSIVSEAIGCCRAKREDLNGQCFHELLCENNLYLPCTFNHIRNHYTYHNKRIDYIAVPQSWKAKNIVSYVGDPVEQQCVKDDHCPTYMHASLCNTVDNDSQWICHRRHYCNVKNFDITTNYHNIARWLIHIAESVPCVLSVSQRSKFVAEELGKMMVDEFPQSQPPELCRHLSQSSKELILQRRDLVKKHSFSEGFSQPVAQGGLPTTCCYR